MYIPQLVLAALFALAGYKEAQRFSRQYGRTPWGWEPWGWALALGLSWVIGIVLLAIAERTGRAQAKRGATTPATYAGQYTGQYVGQYTGQPPMTNHGTPEFAMTASAATPAARWAPDPSGRHQHRWWDGTAWTSHVSTNGVTGQDPVQ